MFVIERIVLAALNACEVCRLFIEDESEEAELPRATVRISDEHGNKRHLCKEHAACEAVESMFAPFEFTHHQVTEVLKNAVVTYQ